MTLPRVLLPVLLTALLVGPGCRAMRQGGATPQEQTTVEVDNRSWSRMTIYVVRGAGDRVRLGEVQASSRRTFVIPAYLITGATPVHFMADPLAQNRTPTSQTIMMQPGDHVTLTIAH